MRRSAVTTAALAACSGSRTISGIAPVLYFPPLSPKTSREEQVKKNTKIAIQMIKDYKGSSIPTYTRKYNQSIEELEKDIESLLGSAQTLRKATRDDQPMDKMTLMERCLRHALWSYHKEEGKYDLQQISKWVVYTPEDEIKFNKMKRDLEIKEALATLRSRRAAEGLPETPIPTFSWTQEYAQSIDREVINAKRIRYDTMALNTMEQDRAKVDTVLQEYKKPTQDKRLDNLVELLDRFKPVLAREAIMQRLTIKHLEGQLGIWRYMDWCPEVRDRAELEVDITGWHWWSPLEERRLLPVRLRTVNEVREIMEKMQAQITAEQTEKNPKKAVTSGGHAERERLLKEVLALQARVNQRTEEPSADGAKAAEKKKASH